MTETALKVEAIGVLIKTFGVLDTERFITSIKSNNFDYTEWHKQLWKDKTIEEIHAMAAELEAEKRRTL
jgi:hypothetical protein